MRRSQIILALVAFAISLFVSAGAFAQTGQLRGHILLKQADGTTVPASGAQVDVYRTDLPGKYPTKADKKGEFVYAGLPYVGTYVIAASAPNAAPGAKRGAKVGRDIDYELVLEPGDGKRYTQEEAVGAASGSGGGGSETAANTAPTESAADRAKREEALKKYEAEKSRVTNINEVMNRAIKAGDAALVAKNYDQAIQSYDEGLNADPEQVVFYSRKSTALRSRGVDHFNASIKATDAAMKTSELESAKKDFQASAETANKGAELAKKEAPASEPSAQAGQTARKLEVFANRAESMRLYTRVDPTQAEAAGTAYQEYVAIEPDPAKKAKAEKDLAQLTFDTASDAAGFERARAAFQKLLEANPDDTNAMLRIGQSLFNIGAMNNNDKAKYQEAANYLQMFVSKAPDSDPLKAEAKDLIEALKAQANVTPEKINTPPRRRRP